MVDRIDFLTRRALDLVGLVVSPNERRDQALRNAERERHAEALRALIGAIHDEARASESYAAALEVVEASAAHRQEGTPGASAASASTPDTSATGAAAAAAAAPN